MTSKSDWLQRPGTIAESWNPIQDVIKGPSGRGYHCTKCSPGCEHCWAEDMNKRFGNRLPFDDRPVEFELMQDVLEKPLRWRKPRTVAVQLMGDFFHPAIPSAFQLQILQMIGKCPQHTFILLTKRTEQLDLWEYVCGWHPYPNLWLVATVVNQEEADRKIPELLRVPAVVHGVSIEPCLGEIDLTSLPSGNPQYPILDALTGMTRRIVTTVERREYCSYDEDTYYDESIPKRRLGWTIIGGESGSGARPMYPDWARRVRDDCQDVNVPYFFKQWGEWTPYQEEFATFTTRHSNHSDPNVGHQYIRHIGPSGHPDVFHKECQTMVRVGKERTGHLLDGKEYHEWPIG